MLFILEFGLLLVLLLYEYSYIYKIFYEERFYIEWWWANPAISVIVSLILLYIFRRINSYIVASGAYTQSYMNLINFLQGFIRFLAGFGLGVMYIAKLLYDTKHSGDNRKD